jgi:hypothetical protein
MGSGFEFFVAATAIILIPFGLVMANPAIAANAKSGFSPVEGTWYLG